MVLIITIRTYIKLKRPSHSVKRGKSQIDVGSYKTRLLISLSDCDVKTSKYFEESERPLSRITMLDGLYNGERNVIQTEKTVTVFVYTYVKPDGTKIKYHSPPVYKDESVIQRCINTKAQTFIYSNSNTDYYFDVSFLL